MFLRFFIWIFILNFGFSESHRLSVADLSRSNDAPVKVLALISASSRDSQTKCSPVARIWCRVFPDLYIMRHENWWIAEITLSSSRSSVIGYRKWCSETIAGNTDRVLISNAILFCWLVTTWWVDWHNRIFLKSRMLTHHSPKVLEILSRFWNCLILHCKTFWDFGDSGKFTG
jgi:hypothetical protein